MSKTALVTGATGMLGSNLVRELVAQNWRVKAQARDPEKACRYLGDVTAEWVQGDLEDIDAWVDALNGVEVIFHTAAFFREYYQPGDHRDRLHRLNVEAVGRLLREAEAKGVRRFVHTSSSGVLETREGPADEASPVAAFARENLYFQSKVQAEELVREFLKTSRMDVVLALPGWMMGPGDAAPTAAGQIILDFARGRMPGLLDGGAAATDARDVALAMILAAERGRRGERYVFSGPYASLGAIARHLESLTGTPAPRATMPSWLALAVARLSETAAALTRRPTVMTVSGVRTMLEKTDLRSDKAVRELGARFRPLEETLRDTVAWYRRHGFLPAA